MNKIKEIKSNDYIWNALASIANAGQSVILLIFISRVCGIEASGIYTISFAYANMLLGIGKFGIRKYQVTDINEKFVFSDYLYARHITVLFMVVGGVGRCMSGMILHESFEKIVSLFLLCVWKIVDCYDDLFFGTMQQKKYMYIGARNNLYRNLASVFCAIITILLSKSLVWSLVVGTGCNLLCLCFSIKFSYLKYVNFKLNHKFFPNAIKLLALNVSLVIGDTVANYLANLPKYVIELFYNSSWQGVYGILSLPILAISLLTDFVFMPVLPRFAELWDKKQFVLFSKNVLRQICYIFAISFGVILIGVYIGLPLMEWIYKVELSCYKYEFVVLLVSGGFVSMAGLLYTLIVAIRKQWVVIPLFLGTSIIALFYAYFLSENGRLIDAILPYLLAYIIITCFFSLFILLFIFKESKNTSRIK